MVCSVSGITFRCSGSHVSSGGNSREALVGDAPAGVAVVRESFQYWGVSLDTGGMPISKGRGFFGGTKLTFKCPICGATMPIKLDTLASGKLTCKSCAKVHALSGADAALLDELRK